MVSGFNPTDNDPDPAERAEEDDLDYVEYYEDGEWCAVLMDGITPVASGFGESPEAARKSIFGTTNLD